MVQIDHHIYLEKQVNDIKIRPNVLHSRKYVPNKIYMHFIILSILTRGEQKVRALALYLFNYNRYQNDSW